MGKQPSTTKDHTEALGKWFGVSGRAQQSTPTLQCPLCRHMAKPNICDIRRDHRMIPWLRKQRNTDASIKIDKFGQCMNQVQTAIAQWSNGAEESWSNEAKVAKTSCVSRPRQRRHGRYREVPSRACWP